MSSPTTIVNGCEPHHSHKQLETPKSVREQRIILRGLFLLMLLQNLLLVGILVVLGENADGIRKFIKGWIYEFKLKYHTYVPI